MDYPLRTSFAPRSSSVFDRGLPTPAKFKALTRQKNARFSRNTAVLITAPSTERGRTAADRTNACSELIPDDRRWLPCVTRYQPTGDKTMRPHAQTAVTENGFVHIPETAPWLAEYLHEMTVFPNGKHDDHADSTAQFLDWLKRPSSAKHVRAVPPGRRSRRAAPQTATHPNRMSDRLHGMAFQAEKIGLKPGGRSGAAIPRRQPCGRAR
jgi:hypothetical protein